VNRSLPPNLINELKSFKRGKTTFKRKGEVLQSWRDIYVVNMSSTIHTSNIVDVPRRNKTVKKKPLCISQYTVFFGRQRARYLYKKFKIW
jgi:hypothetical protein